jgi:two-component system, response regulator PdtaR
MPGALDGLRLAEIVRARWPDVVVVVTSGHCRVSAASAREAVLFVPKPYRDYELASALRAAGRRARH